MIRHSHSFSVLLALLSILHLLYSCEPTSESQRKSELSPLDSAIAIAKEVEATIPGDSGLVLYHRALEMAKEQNNFGKQIYLHDKVAENYSYYDQPEVCKAHIDTALQIAEIHDTHYEYIGMCYSTLATYHTRKGNHKKGLDLYHKTLNYRLKHLGEDHEDISNSYFVLGYYYLVTRKEYDKAIFYNEKALEMRMAAYGKESREAGEVYGNLAFAYSKIGDIQKALTYQQKAVEISEKYSPKDGRNLLYDYMSIARYNYNLGNKTEALRWLDLIKKAKYNEENEYVKISNDIQIADYILTTDPDSSKTLYRSSLKKLEKKYGARSPFTFIAYLNLGLYFSQVENFDSAIYHVNVADSIVVTAYGKNSIQYINFLPNKINLFYKFKRYDNAISKATEAIFILNSNSIQKEITTNLSGDYPVRIDVANNLYFRGRAYLAKGDINSLEKALTDFEDVINILEKVKKRYTTDNSRALLSQNSQFVYNDAINASLKLAELKGNTDYYKKAFVIAEKARAFNLLNDIQESKAKTFAGIPDSIIVQEEKLKSDIVFYKDLVYRYSQYLGPEDPQVVEAKASLLDLRRQFDKLIYQIESEYPKYYRLKVQSPEADVDKLIKNLKPNEAILEYYVGKTFISIFLLSVDGLIVNRIKKSDDFEASITNLIANIEQRKTEDFDEISKNLFEILISPIKNKISDKVNTLRIIPHDKLTLLPFECLVSTVDNRFLIESYEITYHFSSNLLQLNEKSDFKFDKIAIFAPVFDNIDHIPSLKWTYREAEMINKVLQSSGFNTSSFLRKKASKKAFLNIENDFDIIHLATHTQLDTNNILQSKIIFTPDERENELRLAETFNLNTKAKLITLSSCDTGNGELLKGDGILSFSSGFAYCGIENIVSSLWKVDDLYTSELMIAFYKNIAQGETISKSLRKAKLKLIREHKNAAPREWASFILIEN